MLPSHTACRYLSHVSGVRCRAAAAGQARATLPRRFFARLLERFGTAVQRSALDDGRWQGHRLGLIEGAGGSMPDTPALQEAFGQPTEQRPGCGVPVARRLGLCPAGTGMLLTRVVAPLLTHDLAQVPQVHPMFAPGDGLVADRALCSYAHLALLVQAGVHAVRRVGAHQLVDVTPGRPLARLSVRRTAAGNGVPRSRWRTALGVDDPLVAWLQPKTRPSWLTRDAWAALPEAVVLREVRDHIGTPGLRTRQLTLGTTRLDGAIYRVADLAELYRQRWQIETSLAPLKTTMPMEVLHGQTVPGVLKELTVFALVYHLVRMVMCQSATRQPIGVERISLFDALRGLSAPSPGRP